jgi:hypothetical protein
MSSRAKGALALQPTGKSQGGYYFYSITTGRVINRNSWTAFPMAGEVVGREHVLSMRGKQHTSGLNVLGKDGISGIDDVIARAEDGTEEIDDDDESWRPDQDADNESVVSEIEAESTQEDEASEGSPGEDVGNDPPDNVRYDTLDDIGVLRCGQRRK